jgi:adhesin transport system membrane fusion protein
MSDVVSSHGSAKRIFGTLLLLVVLVGVIGFGIWANFSSLDISTHAQGVVIPSSRIQSIQSLDGGILDKALVKEGDIVEKGQLLLRLDKVKTQSMYRETLARNASLKAAIARLNAEVLDTPLKFPASLSGFPDVVAAQRMLYQKRKVGLEEEIAVLERSAELAKKELSLNEPMLVTGEVSEVDVIRLRRQVNEIRGAISQRKYKFLSDAQTDLVKAEDELASQSEVLTGRKDQFEHTDIFAPLKGVVKNVRITTEGGVVRPAEEIMQIVPLEEELLIDIKINPVDVAFLRPGLPATVKIDAYDYTIYGMLDGELTYLSPDTLREETAREDIKYYRGTLRTHGSELKNPRNERIQIIPGMTATAEIKTGERTVMQYLLQPITRGLSESLHER